MVITDWSLPGADRQCIFGTTHLPAPEIPVCGMMIICHGFKGYKDYGFIPQLAAAACQRGIIAHRFNFSHSGVTQDHQTFARPDLFERDTWGKQIHDLKAVVAAAAEDQLPGAASGKLPMCWYGHSRGGVTVLLGAAIASAASNHTIAGRPVGIIAAAAPQSSCSLDPDQVHRLRRRGYLETPSSRTGQVLRVGKTWLEEMEQDPAAYDPLAAIGKVRCPVLLIHGDNDETVPVGDAHRLKSAAGDRARLEVLAGASHTFNAPNPLPLDQTPPAPTDQMIRLACDFAENLCGTVA